MLLCGPQFDYQFTQLYLWLSTVLSSREAADSPPSCV